jgi:O-antigen/teichoic acid export membrane protein
MAILGRLSTFRRGFVSTFSFDVVARGLSAVATVMFIRALDVGSFAYLVLFLNVGQFAGSALTGGFRMRYMREEAERVSRGEKQATGFALAVVASLALILVVAAVAAGVVSLAGIGGTGHDGLWFVALTALYTAGHASIEMAMYHYQAHLRFSRAGLLGVARSVAIFAVAAVATLGAAQSGVAISAATALAVFAVAIAVCAPLIRDTLDVSLPATLRGDFRRESGWLTVYYLASAGFAYADIFIVASFLNDAAVASYGAALRYIAIVLGPMPALIAVTRVRTSQHDIVDSPHLQVSMLMSWIRRTILPVGAALAAIALLAPVLIPLVDGGRYPDSVPIFQLMLLPALVGYTTMPSPNLLMSQRRYRLLAGFYSIVLGLQLVAASFAAALSGVVAVAAVASVVGACEAGGVTVLAARKAKGGLPVREEAAP